MSTKEKIEPCVYCAQRFGAAAAMGCTGCKYDGTMVIVAPSPPIYSMEGGVKVRIVFRGDGDPKPI